MNESNAVNLPRGLHLALLFAGLLASFYAVVLFFITPDIVIAKLHDDALIYFAQAQQLALSGSTTGLAYGDGLQPIVFAPVAAYVRLPVFLLFHDLASVVRAIQVQNVILLVCLGLLSWRYLSLRLPAQASAKWCYVPFAMLATSYTPWFSNAYLPLSDHIFAILSMTFVLLCLEHDWWLASRIRSLVWFALLLATLVISTLQKGTAIAIVAYPVLLFSKKLSRRQLIASAMILMTFVAVTAVAERELYRFYISAFLTYSIKNRPLGELVLDSFFNFFASALPTQIIPDFNFTFLHRSDLTLGLRVADFQLLWVPFFILGLAISAVILQGAWAARKFLGPELGVIFFTAPIYALIVNGGGTIRYLAFLQPFFLVLFVTGLQALRSRFRNWRAPPRVALLGVSALILAGIAGASASTMAAPMREALSAGRFLSDLDQSFAAERKVVVSLPNRNMRFVNIVDGNARWYSVAHVRYTDPAMVPDLLCRGFTVYWVFDCDRRNCAVAHLEERKAREKLAKPPGSLRWTTIYQTHSVAAEVAIQRIMLDRTTCRSAR